MSDVALAPSIANMTPDLINLRIFVPSAHIDFSTLFGDDILATRLMCYFFMLMTVVVFSKPQHFLCLFQMSLFVCHNYIEGGFQFVNNVSVRRG